MTTTATMSSESALLLPNENPSPPLEDAEPPTLPQHPFLLPRILHSINLLISLTLLILSSTVHIQYQNRPPHYSLYWRIEEEFPWAITWSFITILYTTTGFIRYYQCRKLIPNLIGLILHNYIGFWELNAAGDGISNARWSSGQCREWYSPKNPPRVDEGCLEWARGFDKLIWGYLILLAVFAAVHLILFCVYVVYTYKDARRAWRRREEWRRRGSWGLDVPVWVLSFEFSVRFGREGERERISE
ncbi:hypothetical protein QBC38DRAFT_486195 [Podospora fimiseda]|uniref:Uncharacterized protein n=1 Tax=Podospora fimiseda TaxID=252190 RepID=A0AAN7BIY6_9PEZI|nr:hypothetical protein QBC38DRAFT_486195 [Podospora fimiseda]